MKKIICLNCCEEVVDCGYLFQVCPNCGIEMLYGNPKRLSDEEEDDE